MSWKYYYFFSPTETKKIRTTGQQPKEAASEETNETVFIGFVKEAGVNLKHDGSSHEIGKRTPSVIKKNPHELTEWRLMLTSIFCVLAVDQVVFQKRIQQQLQKSPRYPGVSIIPAHSYISNVRVTKFSTAAHIQSLHV